MLQHDCVTRVLSFLLLHCSFTKTRFHTPHKKHAQKPTQTRHKQKPLASSPQHHHKTHTHTQNSTKPQFPVSRPQNRKPHHITPDTIQQPSPPPPPLHPHRANHHLFFCFFYPSLPCREQTQTRRYAREFHRQNQAHREPSALHRSRRSGAAVENHRRIAARIFRSHGRRDYGPNQKGRQNRPIEGLRLYTLRFVRRSNEGAVNASLYRRSLVRGKSAEQQRGQHTASAVESVCRSLFRGHNRRRSEGVL